MLNSSPRGRNICTNLFDLFQFQNSPATLGLLPFYVRSRRKSRSTLCGGVHEFEMPYKVEEEARGAGLKRLKRTRAELGEPSRSVS